MKAKELTESEALVRVAGLCGTKECCCSEVQGKLVRMGLAEDAVARIMQRLVEEKYIDERRFARAYALDKFRYNGWGRIRIAQGLRLLAVSEQDARGGMAEIPEEEYDEKLRALLVAKARQTKGRNDYERRGKVVRFAVGRGFEMGAVLDAIDATHLFAESDSYDGFD